MCGCEGVCVCVSEEMKTLSLTPVSWDTGAKIYANINKQHLGYVLYQKIYANVTVKPLAMNCTNKLKASLQIFSKASNILQLPQHYFPLT